MALSRKLIRLTIMDALDQVLMRKPRPVLSSKTKMIIIEAAEKIAESVEQDYYAAPEEKTLKKIKAENSANKSVYVGSKSNQER